MKYHNVKYKLLTGMILGCTIGLTACSSSSSDSDTNSNSSEVSGRVADGYLKGATVCLDKNINGKCDQGEPKTVTTTGGKYLLKNISNEDVKKYPILVVADSNTIDEDTGEAITKEYTLMAPPGKPKFVSPITSMIATKYLTDPKVTLEAAEAEVKGKIGNIDPYVDFIQKEKAGDDNYKKAHKVAQVVTKVIAQKNEEINQQLNNLNLGDKERMVVMSIIAKVVDTVIAQVVDEINSNETYDVDIEFNVIESKLPEVTEDDLKSEVTKIELATSQQEMDISAIVSEGKTFFNVFIDENNDGTYKLGAASFKLAKEGLYRYDCQKNSLMNDLDTCLNNVSSDKADLLKFSGGVYKFRDNYSSSDIYLNEFVSTALTKGKKYRYSSILGIDDMAKDFTEEWMPSKEYKIYNILGIQKPFEKELPIPNNNSSFNEDNGWSNSMNPSLYGKNTVREFINNPPSESSKINQNGYLWWLEGDVANQPSSVKMHICEARSENGQTNCKSKTEIIMNARLKYDLNANHPWFKILNPGSSSYDYDVYYVQVSSTIYAKEILAKELPFSKTMFDLETAKALVNKLRTSVSSITIQ